MQNAPDGTPVPQRPRWLRPPTIALLAALTLLLSACDGDTASHGDGTLEGGILATFRVEHETFRVWITKDATIEQVLDLQAGRSQANIPNGPLLAGSGAGDHNEPWGWHLDPEETEMAENTIEVCDGRPSLVEADLDYWLNTVGRFCPWGAALESVEDFRQ